VQKMQEDAVWDRDVHFWQPIGHDTLWRISCSSVPIVCVEVYTEWPQPL